MANDMTPHSDRIDADVAETEARDTVALSRRRVLGAGAAALGGLALGELSRPAGAAAAASFISAATKSVAIALAGSTNIKVSSVDGFIAGAVISIDAGTALESAVAASVGTAGKSGSGITLTMPLVLDHPKGAAVTTTSSVTALAGRLPDVLHRIVTDSAYAGATLQSPQKIQTDYPQITLLELDELRRVAVLSGSDMTMVNKVRGQSMIDHAGDPGTVTQPGGGVLAFSYPTCCCCCCCIGSS
jgi:hypothetical protein